MKKLKIIAPEWLNYTGSLGKVHFTNGLSDQFIPDHIRCRLSIGMAMVEINSEGNEEPASPTHKMIQTASMRSEVIEPLTSQDDNDKAREMLDVVFRADGNTPIYTRAELEAIADKEGIKGVRDIADRWHVKHRSIPTLINMVLDAQERFVVNCRKNHVDRIAQELTVNEALKIAAMTGDVSAAINAVKQEKTGAENQAQSSDNNDIAQNTSETIDSSVPDNAQTLEAVLIDANEDLFASQVDSIDDLLHLSGEENIAL